MSLETCTYCNGVKGREPAGKECCIWRDIEKGGFFQRAIGQEVIEDWTQTRLECTSGPVLRVTWVWSKNIDWPKLPVQPRFATGPAYKLVKVVIPPLRGSPRRVETLRYHAFAYSATRFDQARTDAYQDSEGKMFRNLGEYFEHQWRPF